MMTTYELLYSISATFTDNDVGAVEGNVKALLEKHGAALTSTTRLGKFRLAYPIAQVKYGHYVLAHFTAEGAAVKELDTALRISPEVLRHLILRAEDAGGEKFDFVQFAEVNLDTRERTERPRHRTPDLARVVPEVKSGVPAAQEEAPRVEKVEEAKPAVEISAEELEKKIDAALEEKT